MRKNILFLVLASLCLNISSLGQSKVPDSLSFEIGDQLPESFWQQEHLFYSNGNTAKQNLSAYKGKLIILDFWATWCSACLEGFPKMSVLEKQFNGQLVVLKATNETLEKIKSFEQGPAGGSLKKEMGARFSSIILDKSLASTFPHRLLPFLTYIGPDGKVVGFGDVEDLNPELISNMLQGKNSPFLNRKDHDMDLPVFINDSSDKLISYSVLYKGHLSGLSGGNFLRERDGKVYGQAVTNMPMDWIYKTALIKLYPWYQDNLVILEVANPGAFTAYNVDGSNPDEKSMLNTLDMRVPADRIDSLYVDMLQVLNHNSGFIGKPEKRMLKCLVLSKTAKGKNTSAAWRTAGGKRHVSLFEDNKAGIVTNAPISVLINAINRLEGFEMPILNETEITEKVDLKVGPFTTLEALDESLNRYGLQLKQSEKLLDVFVIRDKK